LPASLIALVDRAKGKNDKTVEAAAAKAVERLRVRRDDFEKKTADELLQAVDLLEDQAEKELGDARRATSSSSAQSDFDAARRATNEGIEKLNRLTGIKKFAIEPEEIDKRLQKVKKELEDAENHLDTIDKIEDELRQAECVAAARQCASNAQGYARQADSAESGANSSSSSSSARNYARQADSAADSADSEADKIRRLKSNAPRPGELSSYLSTAESAASSARSSARNADSRADTLRRREEEERRRQEEQRRREAAARAASAARSSSSHGSSGRGGGGSSSI